MKMFMVAVLLVGAVGLLACERLPQLGLGADGKLASASQEDCGYVQNSYGQRVSWKQALPVKIFVDPTFPDEYFEVLKAAGARWESGLQRSAFIFERASERTSPAWDGKNVLYYQNPWESTSTKLEGVTSLSWYRNQIVEADIKINAANYKYFLDTPDTNSEIHLESLLVHELGHFLGLKHATESSVMLEVLEYSQKRELPTPIDKNHLLCEYK